MKSEKITYYDIHTHQPAVRPEDVAIFSLDLRNNNLLASPFSSEENFLKNCALGYSEIKNRSEYYSVGIHPWYPEKSLMKKVSEYAISPLVVAIGETGLDKITANSTDNFKLQQELFIEHITISEKVGKPLIIHCVKAWDELLRIRKAVNPTRPWIVHGFRGKAALAEQLMDAGMYLSFSSTYNTDSLKAAWKKHCLLTETDDTNTDICNVYSRIANNLEISNKELSDEIGLFFDSFCSSLGLHYLCTAKNNINYDEFC